MAETPPDTGTPRWIKISGIAIIILTVLLVTHLIVGHPIHISTRPSGLRDLESTAR